jgi:tetratricopeptide (TPR) repeat protein
MTARLAAAFLVAAAVAAALPARGDDVAEARARFRKGADLYRQRRWRDAIAEFEAAYRLKPHGAIHFNVAQCRERLGDWPGALRGYHDYLREVPEATDRATVRASLARLEARLATTGAQVLVVYSDPPGARVSLDGRERGTTPLHAALPPGSYALALALDGWERVAETVELSASASRVVDVALRRAPAASPAAAPAAVAAELAGPAAPEREAASPRRPDLAPQGAPEAEAASPRRSDLAPRPPASALPAPLAPPLDAPPPPARTRRYMGAWIAAGTAVAAAGAGAWLGWSARRDERAIDALPAPDRAAASARAADARAKARAANLLYAIAGGAAAAGGALFVVEGRF